MLQNSHWNRRRFISSLAAGGLFFTRRGLFAETLALTPAQTEGPYYPDRLPLDQDNDLLVINDSITPAVGTVAWIGGRILDRNGSPIRAAQIEIWQADNLGAYIHSRGTNNGRRDANFQGYGRFLTSSTGEYLFRTIKPGLYPGRVRHVHRRITLPGGQTLTSQLYIEGETGNDGVLDGVSVRINGQPALVASVSPATLRVLAPANSADIDAEITVTNDKGLSDPVKVRFERLQPGFFQEALEYVRATRADGVRIGPPELIKDVETVAARPGDEITLSASYASPGNFEVRIRIPELALGDYPVTAEVDGVRTAKFVRIPVRP